MKPDSSSILVVVSRETDWDTEIPGTVVVTSREYLTNPQYGERRSGRVINLCRSFRYQRAGYYVSLLGTARGHRPVPSLATIQQSKSSTVIRLVSDELEDLIAKSLSDNDGAVVVLESYFGREVRGRYPALTKALFGRLPLPLMRATFTRNEKSGRWALHTCNQLRPADVRQEDLPLLAEAMRAFVRRRAPSSRRDLGLYDLAILTDPGEAEPPSDEGALKRFSEAAAAEGFAVEFIDRDDYARIAEFDALFIRETTAVNHRTFRFAQRAATEGLVVIDDPESILRCTNKVFLAEVLGRKGVPAPRTVIAHRGNLEQVIDLIGLPCVLKQPDSSFSQGVVKVETLAEFREATRNLLRKSDLIVAQAFTPSPFDWRIGLIGGKPLYACKYFMARRHWQIIRREEGKLEEGGVEAVPLDQVPAPVLAAAVAAGGLMGDGLYGVDLKEVDGRPFVIEVNDNPSIDAGFEDALLGASLYRSIMADFRRRLDERRTTRVT